MINSVSINHKEQKEYPHPCHIAKCPNPGRYQLYAGIESRTNSLTGRAKRLARSTWWKKLGIVLRF